MLFAISTEIGQRIEIHPVRYLRERIARVVQVFLENRDSMPVNVRHDGMTGMPLYGGGQVFLRYVELPCKPANRPLCARVPFGEQTHKFTDNIPSPFS